MNVPIVKKDLAYLGQLQPIAVAGVAMAIHMVHDAADRNGFA